MFRDSGEPERRKVVEMIHRVNNGESLDLAEEKSPSVAALLRKFLQLLPSPVIQYKVIPKDPELAIGRIENLLETLTPVAKETFRALIRLLSKVVVAADSKTNTDKSPASHAKTPIERLSKMLAPAIARSESNEFHLEENENAVRFLEFVLKNAKNIPGML